NWLLLKKPNTWTNELKTRFRAMFRIFLQSLEDEETEADEIILPEERLSVLMRESMESGQFWLSELMQQSFSFDEDMLWCGIEIHLENWDCQRLGFLMNLKSRHLCKRK